MPKILGNNSGKNNKSCRIFHNESNKIGIAFLWFLYDFLRIFKVSEKALYYLRFGFTGRPLELLSLLQIGPNSRKRPWKEWGRRNVVPGHGGRRGSPELGGSGGALGRGRGGEGRGTHRGSTCAHGRGRDALGGGLRRWPAVPVAGASAPVEGRRRQCVHRHGEVVWLVWSC
jgi:hypothetical protein